MLRFRTSCNLCTQLSDLVTDSPEGFNEILQDRGRRPSLESRATHAKFNRGYGRPTVAPRASCYHAGSSCYFLAFPRGRPVHASPGLASTIAFVLTQSVDHVHYVAYAVVLASHTSRMVHSFPLFPSSPAKPLHLSRKSCGRLTDVSRERCCRNGSITTRNRAPR